MEARELVREGALMTLRWMVGVGIGIMGIGATTAGLVLGFLVRGG